MTECTVNAITVDLIHATNEIGEPFPALFRSPEYQGQ